MTRIKYRDINPVIISSNKFLISSNTFVEVRINKASTMFSIVDQNLSVLFQETCSSVRECKRKARIKLKEIGANLYDEVRN